MNTQIALVASAVFLSAALATSYHLCQKSALEPSEVLTWDCELPVFKPETIMIYCGDGGGSSTKLSGTLGAFEGCSLVALFDA